ncbi:hypothetical protein BCR34DRAFT_247477 [Clohesyomyces aquaticus]|uniref:Uncharacterized protein n=1 Tax=Clohesyomyces aquaticus TaxID=1231657 RepID=A0A1Y1ZUZ2_9PLEO|nr:hypothetical protein BCR34DRAFT_247477 [Clohesyomyces aquaticus]
MRKWIGRFCAFVWGTERFGSYLDFCDFLHMDPSPQAAFLYELAKIKFPFTKGLDVALLENWCT